jgi:hypothetical protein
MLSHKNINVHFSLYWIMSLYFWCILCRAGSVGSYNIIVTIHALYVEVVGSLVKYVNYWVQGVVLFRQTRDWSSCGLL